VIRRHPPQRAPVCRTVAHWTLATQRPGSLPDRTVGRPRPRMIVRDVRHGSVSVTGP
jgi:hypothetical protein